MSLDGKTRVTSAPWEVEWVFPRDPALDVRNVARRLYVASQPRHPDEMDCADHAPRQTTLSDCNRLHLATTDRNRLRPSRIGSRMTTRREQIREAINRHRKRRKRGDFWRPIMVTKAQLDQLEVRGYLDPDRRGERADKCDAIASFLRDSLAKSD